MVNKVTSPSQLLHRRSPNEFPAYRIAAARFGRLAVFFNGYHWGTDFWSCRNCIAIPSFHGLSPQRRSGKNEPG